MPYTLTIQPDPTAGIDTTLDQNNPTTNLGTDTGLYVGSGAGGNRYRALLKFDLSGIPANAVVSSATLSLYCSGAAGAGTLTIARILSGNSSWTEAGACWNTRDGSNNWAGSAGCSSLMTDYFVVPLYSGDPGTATGDWHTFAFNLGEFSSMRSANCGMLLFLPATPNLWRFYYSSDYVVDAALRPKLTINYTLHKYAQADGNWDAAIWYDAASGGNPVSTPGVGDTANLNGLNIALNVNPTCDSIQNQWCGRNARNSRSGHSYNQRGG
jgi:hypothetical protein